MLGTAEIVSVLGVTALMGWACRRLWRRGRRWEPSVWAERSGLTLTPDNSDLVRAYVTRTRDLRLACAVGAFLAPHIHLAARGEPLPLPFDFDLFDALVGYLLGAIAAEIAVQRPTGPVPSASLTPRRLPEYLSPWLIVVLRALAATTLAVIVLYRVLPERIVGADPQMPPTIVIAAAVVIVWLGVEVAQRYIVGRAQPAVAADIIEADDAIRSASVRALAGAGIALELLVLSIHVVEIGTASDAQLLRWTLPWVGGSCFLLAIVSWVAITQPTARRATAVAHA